MRSSLLATNSNTSLLKLSMNFYGCQTILSPSEGRVSVRQTSLAGNAMPDGCLLLLLGVLFVKSTTCPADFQKARENPVSNVRIHHAISIYLSIYLSFFLSFFLSFSFFFLSFFLYIFLSFCRSFFFLFFLSFVFLFFFFLVLCPFGIASIPLFI